MTYSCGLVPTCSPVQGMACILSLCLFYAICNAYLIYVHFGMCAVGFTQILLFHIVPFLLNSMSCCAILDAPCFRHCWGVTEWYQSRGCRELGGLA